MALLDMFRKKQTRRAFVPSRRGYDAAKTGRLFSDWTTTNKSAAGELRDQLRVLRARSRELCQNNDYARRFLRLQTTNIVGPLGIQFEPRATESNGAPDDAANQQIAARFSEWSRKGICTVDGGLSFIDAQRLFVETVCRDGEVIVRLAVSYTHLTLPTKRIV